MALRFLADIVELDGEDKILEGLVSIPVHKDRDPDTANLAEGVSCFFICVIVVHWLQFGGSSCAVVYWKKLKN